MSEEYQIILPDGFKRVEFLEVNGSQYIDTKYIPTNETGYSVIFQTHQSDTIWRPVFGLYEPNITNNRIYLYTNPYPCVGWHTAYQLTTQKYEEIICNFNYLNNRKVDITDKENSLSYDLEPLNFIPSVPVYLFSAYGASNITNNGSMIGKISSFIITEGNEVVRKFIPCLDTNDEPCMYDILGTGAIEENTYYNQGTGKFLTSKDLEWNYPHLDNNYNLPAGFKKCVYLQSDGTQWIDTGVVPDNETGLYFKALQLSYGNFIPFGVTDGGNEIYLPRFSSKDLYYRWGASAVKMMTWDKADDLIFHSSLNLYNSKIAKFDSEDTDVVSFITSQAGTYTLPIWLFSYNFKGSYNSTYGKWMGRIYRAQITQGDALIRDFVPCLDADNRPCMYDLITQEAYYNQSGGTEFVYCLEHELPSDFVKLKYLESTGTQIIKTGIIPTDSTGIYVDAYHTKYNGDTDWSVIGLRNTNGNTYFTVGRVQRDTNGAGFGWGAFTIPGGTGNVRYEASLNFLNDRQSIITAPSFAQRINALGTLSFTPTKDLYMFGMNNYDGAATLYSTYRIYRAKISEGSEIVRDWVPAYDTRKDKSCMYDLINNIAYYNDGTDEFLRNRDVEGTYKGYTGLGCIGNKLGSDYDPINEKLPSGYTRVEFLESTGTQWINTDLYVKDLSFRIEYAGITGGGGNGTMVFGIEPGASGNFYGVITQANNYGIGYQTRCFKTSEGMHQALYVDDVSPETKAISEVNLVDLYCYIKVEGKGTQKNSIINLTHDFADYAYPCGLFSRQEGGIKTVSRVYSFSANYNDVPAANYIPAIDTIGVPCMYDTVTDKSLYNQGSGQFIVGLKTLSHALQLYLPDSGGTISLSLPTNDKTEIYEEKIRANNPNWEITFYYH